MHEFQRICYAKSFRYAIAFTCRSTKETGRKGFEPSDQFCIQDHASVIRIQLNFMFGIDSVFGNTIMLERTVVKSQSVQHSASSRGGIIRSNNSIRAKYEVAFSIRSQMLYPVELRAPGKR